MINVHERQEGAAEVATSVIGMTFSEPYLKFMVSMDLY
jgi:hypothetical protein